MRIAFTAGFLMALAAPAFAQQGEVSPPVPPAATAPQASGETPVAPGSVERKEVTGTKSDPLLVVSCIQSDPPTGSRLGAHKTCHTQAQWNSIRANSAQDLMDMDTRYSNSQEGKLLAAGR